MQKEIAILLMSAILDNTLNFKAKITNNRDIIAYKKLEKIVGNTIKYDEKYFLECQKNKEIVYETLNNISDKWMINVISLKDGKSYIIANNEEVKKKLEKLFNRAFINDIMELDSVWLRKEIIKMAKNITEV